MPKVRNPFFNGAGFCNEEFSLNQEMVLLTAVLLYKMGRSSLWDGAGVGTSGVGISGVGTSSMLLYHQ